MQIKDLLVAGRIVHLKEKTKTAALTKLVRVLAKTDEVSKEKELSRAIFDRERILSTGIGYGIAIPHAKIGTVSKFIAAVGISKEGIAFESLDSQPVHIIVMIAGPEGQNEEYLRILARFTSVLKPEETRTRIIDTKNSAQIMEIFMEPR